jgi:hypothetical protein
MQTTQVFKKEKENISVGGTTDVVSMVPKGNLHLRARVVVLEVLSPLAPEGSGGMRFEEERHKIIDNMTKLL